MLDLTRQYTAEITNLVHEKNKLKDEVDNLNINFSMLKEDA